MLVPNRVFPVHTFCDNESSRYALGGVLFERSKGTPYAVSTDGRAMVAASWDEMPAGESKTPKEMLAKVADYSAIIAAEACKKAPKLVKLSKRLLQSKPALAHVAIHEGATNGKSPMFVTDLEQNVAVDAPTIEGRFPAWRDVIPGYNRGNSVSVCVDPHYLADILKTVATIGTTEEARGVVLTIKDKDTPVLVTADHAGARAVGVVMPLRGSEESRRPKHRQGDPISPAWLPQGVERDAKYGLTPTVESLCGTLRNILRIEEATHQEGAETAEDAIARIRAIAHDALQEVYRAERGDV